MVSLQALASFPTGDEPLVPIELEADWAPQPVWTFWRREKYLALTGVQKPDCLALNLVTVLTTLSWFCSTAGNGRWGEEVLVAHNCW
jgi:hypothetical protein